MTYFFTKGQLCSCIVQLEKKNIKTLTSKNASFFRGILVILLCNENK